MYSPFKAHNPQRINGKRPSKKARELHSALVTDSAPVYVEVTENWPNRRVRRAVKQGRESRLPPEWKQYLKLVPEFRAALLASKVA
jgi:hypothetical protein